MLGNECVKLLLLLLPLLSCCVCSAVVLGLISQVETSPVPQRPALIASGSLAIMLLQKVGRDRTLASSPTISSCLSAISHTTSTTRSWSNSSPVSGWLHFPVCLVKLRCVREFREKLLQKFYSVRKCDRQLIRVSVEILQVSKFVSLV